jgi:glycosyltransferase involved in cell wall biosynthesis
VVGEFNDGSKADFDARVVELGLGDRVSTEDWMPYDRVLEEIQASHAGLVLFQPGILNHVYALPHKMFDYMLAAKPIVVPAFAEEVADITRESDCGLLVDSAEPRAVAAAFDRLADDAGLCARLGRNGREAVLTRYNWEAEAEKLIAMYRELEAAA